MTTWSDVSQYQEHQGKGIPVDDSYPHRIFCFRTNSGDKQDTLALENAKRAKAMLDAGKLDAVFPYYFFRPGQANCDLHKAVLEQAGLWLHPKSASMVDVEDAGGAITGDQSAEVNDEVQRMRGWYGDAKRVFGYWNPNANPGLWRTRPQGLRLVIPQYNNDPGNLSKIVQPIRSEAFAHQYTDKGSCAPWPNGVDLNHSPLSVPDLCAVLGIKTSGGTVGSTAEQVLEQQAGPADSATGSVGGNKGWSGLAPQPDNDDRRWSQFLGRIVDRQSEVEALGSIIFELTARMKPFESVEAAKHAILNTARGETLLGLTLANARFNLDIIDRLERIEQNQSKGK